MNILYLHGLESKLSPQKETVLKKYGTVLAPDLDYKNNDKIFNYIYDRYKSEQIDCIIGSSMGGFMGYYIAMTFNCPALLFNPALPIRTFSQNIPENLQPKDRVKYNFVLGWQDTIVKATDNLEYFSKNTYKAIPYAITIRPDLAHQIPLHVFEEECKKFLTS
jgi:predicted esterase YcpF (UPF0227 family)